MCGLVDERYSSFMLVPLMMGACLAYNPYQLICKMALTTQKATFCFAETTVCLQICHLSMLTTCTKSGSTEFKKINYNTEKDNHYSQNSPIYPMQNHHIHCILSTQLYGIVSYRSAKSNKIVQGAAAHSSHLSSLCWRTLSLAIFVGQLFFIGSV